MYFYGSGDSTMKGFERKNQLREIQSNDGLFSLPFKEQCLYVAEVFQRIADRRDIKLKQGLVLFMWKGCFHVSGDRGVPAAGEFEEVPMGMGAYVYDERGILSL